MFDKKLLKCEIEKAKDSHWLVVVTLGSNTTIPGNAERFVKLARKFYYKRDAISCKLDIESDGNMLNAPHFYPYNEVG